MPDDFRGKVVAIRFWADWCTYCSAEMPVIDRIYANYRDRGLLVIAVNVGQPKEIARAFVRNFKITYPVLLDPYSVAAKRYGIVRVPATIILDRDGNVRRMIVGEGEGRTFEETIRDML